MTALPETPEAAGVDWPLVCLAWRQVDDGRAAVFWRNGVLGVETPWPLVCQIRGMMSVNGEEDQELLDALAGYIRRMLDRYDRDRLGIPTWPNAAESLFPSLFQQDCGALDLAALLLNELDAFLALTEESHSPFVLETAEMVAQERTAMVDWLEERRWDEDSLLFVLDQENEYLAPMTDESPAGFFPIIWRKLPVAMGMGGVQRASNVLSQPTWTGRGWVVFYALLQATPYQGIRHQMLAMGLPQKADVSVAVAAAWAVFATEEPTGWRRHLLVITAACALLAVLLIPLWQHLPVNVRTPEETARQFCTEGKHADAARMYAALALKEDRDYFLFRQAGEYLHMQDNAAAMMLYDALTAESQRHPSVRLNQALAKYRQGDLRRARAMYERIAADAAVEYPDSAAKAARAAELLQLPLSLAP